jgi:hypothetical protein
MKAILEFDLNDQEQYTEHIRCVKSLDMACALFEIQVNLKKSCINNGEEDINSVFERLNDILEEYDLNTDALIR